MTPIHIETTVETDGELHITKLPCRKGDRVQAVLYVPDSPERERQRDDALRRFNARADASRFRSVGPYPTRDELHERH
jgi:hypothetical protein